MEREESWESEQRENNKKDKTILTPLSVGPCKLYRTPIMFARFVCECLSFVHESFLRKPKPDNPGEILWTAPHK